MSLGQGVFRPGLKQDNTMTDAAARPRARRTSALAQLLWLLATGLMLCQATIWLQPASPWLALLDEFAVQLSGLALLGTAIALAMRRWRLATVLIVLGAIAAWPLLAHRSQAAVVAEGPRLKVLSANLFYFARDHQPALDFLLASEADIIGLVELTPAWQHALEPLIAKYPYHVDCFDSGGYCEHMLLSKLPIVKPYAGGPGGDAPIMVGGELDWNGRPITVYATHLMWPLATDRSLPGPADVAAAAHLPGLPPIVQAREAANLALFLETQPADLVVMGDFNGSPWGRVQRAFRAKTGLANRAGWDFTWPSSLPWPLRLPLDHVLSRGHLVVTHFAAGPEIGSDHLPVIAEIGWRD
jgi:endonuclease/exonuclease/phosphatase (EEP) superfamily protein YafD